MIRAAVALLLLAVVAVGLWAISRMHCWQPFGDTICRVETAEPVVALSFDDGPTPRGVEAVLPVLEAHGVHATFFLVGKEIARHPELVQRLKAAGHEIGNHSFSHQRMILKSPGFIRHEVMDTDRLLRAQGVETRLFRPPYFKRFYLLPRQLQQAGMLSITADVTDQAPTSLTAEAYAADMLSRARPGSILLMHPMFGNNQVQRDALPLVLEGLRAKGLRVVTVGELLKLLPA